ncbi:MAG: hypothetical protein Q4D90_04960 [bacterium]|nr:hypothetical protein [bacterium]
MNISVAIVDFDKNYADRLREELNQYEELIISVCTSEEKFYQALETRHFDIVLFNPDISQERLRFAGVKLPICLYSDGMQQVEYYESFVKIIKYQRISSIYKEMIREYANKAGYSIGLDHAEGMQLLAVYSPVGGSGKTTVALTVASQLALQGKRILFLSMEQLDSSGCLFPHQNEGIISLIETIGNREVNFELKCKGLMKAGINQVQYIEGFEKLADYGDVKNTEIESVLQNMRRAGVCDVLVVDMNSFLDDIGTVLIDQADKIILVGKPGNLPLAKLSSFANQAITNQNQQKMCYVYNFSENPNDNSKPLDIPVIGRIHHYGNLELSAMIRAIQKNGEIAADSIIKR